MKIKTFFSHTIEDAIAKARQEWGPEAMLVHSRKAALETRHLGEYEVVFAEGAPPSSTAGGSETATIDPPEGRFATEIAALKQQLESMRRTLAKTTFAPAQWLGWAPHLSDSYALLTAAEISPELAREIVHCAAARAGASTEDASPQGRIAAIGNHWPTTLAEEMYSRCRIDPALGVVQAEGGHGKAGGGYGKAEGDDCHARCRIAALIGPPGSGKTTTLAKLAVNHGLASRRSVLLLSVDTDRVAAADQLRSYAAILGVGFQLLETLSGLAQIIDENRSKDLILIDTPGLGFRDLEEHAPLAQFLSTRRDIDRHLVLSSSMKPADLSRVIDSFQFFRPQHLLFTRLDETDSLGHIFSEAARTRTPLSFVTTGQRIPEDLEAATHARLIDPILAGFAPMNPSGYPNQGQQAGLAGGRSPEVLSAA